MRLRLEHLDRAAVALGAAALFALAVLRPAVSPPLATPASAPTPAADHAGATTTGPHPSAPAPAPHATAPAATPPANGGGHAATTAPRRGVDLSHYQSRVDWPALAAGGVGFVYAKATEGADYVDPTFSRHRAGAAGVDLPFGAYHFFRPDADPLAQAEHFLKVAAPSAGDLAPALDLEIAPPAGEADAYRTAVRAWLDHVAKATGCTPLIYASPAFWSAHLGEAAAETPLWLAEYAARPKPPEKAPAWTLWQHSQTGRAPGVRGVVDLDVAADAGLSAVICAAPDAGSAG